MCPSNRKIKCFVKAQAEKASIIASGFIRINRRQGRACAADGEVRGREDTSEGEGVREREKERERMREKERERERAGADD